MIKRFSGVTIRVKDLDAAVKKYSEVLGVKPRFMKPEEFAYPGLKGVEFPIGEVPIFLVASEKAGTPVAKSLETRGEGVNQIAFEVTDIEQEMKELTEKGMKFLSEKPATTSTGKLIFAHPKSMHGVMIALRESAF